MDSTEVNNSLRSVLRLVRGWEQVDDEEFTIEPLSSAFTNHVYKCSALLEREPSCVLLRIYGTTGGLFSRDADLDNFNLVHHVGLAPRKLAEFKTGRIEEYLHGYRELNASDTAQPKIARDIAIALAQFHFKTSTEMIKAAESRWPVCIWDRLREWLRIAIKTPHSFNLQRITDLMISLERQLKRKSCVGFCHFDLQFGNIMVHRDGLDMRFIDYEYGCLAPIEFDIVNHWREWCSDYNSETPHRLNPNRFPSELQQRKFIQHYLTQLRDLSTDGPPTDRRSGVIESKETCTNGWMAWTEICSIADGSLENNADISESLVEAFRIRVLAHLPVSYLCWALWSIVQSSVSDIDFDYKGYAQQHLDMFYNLCGNE